MKSEFKTKKASLRCINEIKIKLPALSVNESCARVMVAAFLAQLNPAATEIADIKCAVSEAVTNCIVHAYRNECGKGEIYINVKIFEGALARIEIKDKGCGIENITEARQPLFTTDAENERSGMGFTVMESFCDKVRVNSRPGKGTSIVLFKKLSNR